MALRKNHNRKIYYKNLISEHKKILGKTRAIIGLMLDKLEEEITIFSNNNSKYGGANIDSGDSESLSEAQKLSQKFWWGDKESASSILHRLTQLLLKLIPLEQEIAKLDLSKADLAELEEIVEKTKLPEEDLEIINRYLERAQNHES